MYLKALSLVVIAAVALAACKKFNGGPVPDKQSTANSAPANLIGTKWQETKVEMYQIDAAWHKSQDTVYTNCFTNSDYAEFANDTTFEWSYDRQFQTNAPGQVDTIITTSPYLAKLGYGKTGNKFVLNTLFLLESPAGFDVRDTISFITPNTMLFRSVFNSAIVTDSYYTALQ